MAIQQILGGYLVPYNGVADSIKEWWYKLEGATTLFYVNVYERVKQQYYTMIFDSCHSLTIREVAWYIISVVSVYM